MLNAFTMEVELNILNWPMHQLGTDDCSTIEQPILVSKRIEAAKMLSHGKAKTL